MHVQEGGGRGGTRGANAGAGPRKVGMPEVPEGITWDAHKGRVGGRGRVKPAAGLKVQCGRGC